MTPVETLREAARLMRERAEAATPGPWRSFFGRVRLADDSTLMVTTTSGDYADAPYVAAMHPGFALAVARLLKDLADDIEGDYEIETAHRELLDSALAVARTYLGEVS